MIGEGLGQWTEGRSALSASHPIMSCEDAAEFERGLLDSDSKIWEAMQSVGQLLGRGILNEYRFTRYAPEKLSVFAMVGKGHNGGDALLAIDEMANCGAVGEVFLAIAAPLTELKLNTKKAFDLLQKRLDDDTLTVVCCRANGEQSWLSEIEQALQSQTFDICLDGLLGMQFKPPLRGAARGLIERVNDASGIRLRVAVDLPSGIGTESDDLAFQADVTFATGVFKQPLLARAYEDAIGCIRYLDVGFFDENPSSGERVIVDSILDPLRARRPAHTDKRSYGSLLIIAGSRGMPGALMMSVRSALQSGVGLVTVCAPECVVAQLAVQLPEAMWIPWPETPDGGLALEGLYLLRSIQSKATALLVGPGVGSERETIEMLVEAIRQSTAPVVIDADALRREVLAALEVPFIATPHLGEFRRIARLDSTDDDLEAALRHFSCERSGVVVLKGPNTRVAAGDHVFMNTTGNSVLSRGGSGDLLAGMAAGLLAQSPSNPLEVACQSVYWHGKAADVLAVRKGQVALRTTDLLDYYSEALKVGGYGEGVDA